MNPHVRATLIASAVLIGCISLARAQTSDAASGTPMYFLRGGSVPAVTSTADTSLPAPAPQVQTGAGGERSTFAVDPASTRQQIVRLPDVGRPDGILLQGSLWSAGLVFTVRRDDAIVASRLNLVISHSASVAREEGELSVFLNEERVATLPLGRSKGARPRADISLAPGLLRTDNRLRFAYSARGKTADACKVAADGGSWIRIEPASSIFLSSTRLPIADDLAILPRPFVDPSDPLGATVPFVLPEQPDTDTLQAAGTIAAWLGTIGGDKSFRAPVSFSDLPATNAVVLVSGGRYPDGVASVPGTGPRVALVTNPARLDSKLLIVVGENSEELRTAAATLALQAEHPTAGSAELNELLPAPRLPYDAPRWLPTDRPVRLGDIVPTDTLSGIALQDSIAVPFATAPDLYFGSRGGGMLNLRIRRDADSWIDAANSRVAIDLNRKDIDEAPIAPRLKVLSRLREYFFPGTVDDRVAKTLLPAGRLEGDNRLAFRFDLRANAAADCSHLDWSTGTGIDPDSTIDFGNAAHFTRLPDLSLFARAGFPFTRLADLADTAFVVSNQPAAEEVQSLLELLAILGRSTGLPATRHVVITAENVQQAADRHVIVLGTPAGQPLLRKWERYNPLSDTAPDWTGIVLRLLHPFGSEALGPRPDIAGARGFLKSNANQSLSSLATFTSPMNADRVAVVLAATDPAQLPELTRRLGDPRKRLSITGDLYLSSGTKAESYNSGRRHTVGSLPLWQRIQWLARSLGLIVFVAALACLPLFALPIRTLALSRARRLLARGEGRVAPSPQAIRSR